MVFHKPSGVGGGGGEYVLGGRLGGGEYVLGGRLGGGAMGGSRPRPCGHVGPPVMGGTLPVVHRFSFVVPACVCMRRARCISAMGPMHTHTGWRSGTLFLGGGARTWGTQV